MKGREMHAVMLKAMTHKMTIYLNMLSALTKDYIVSNLNSTLVVTIYIGVGSDKETPMLESNQCSQNILLVVEGMARYSISAEERETIDCFLLFQEMRVA